MKQKRTTTEAYQFTGIGVALVAGLGAAIGAAIGGSAIALGISIGAGVGVALGAAMDGRRGSPAPRRKSQESSW